MSKGSLTHNCLNCRRARTKCDRTAPCCRRCVRLGLVCSGGEGPKPRRGRPKKDEEKKNQRQTEVVGKANTSKRKHSSQRGVEKSLRKRGKKSTRVLVRSSTGRGMTPCRQMQMSILSVVLDAYSPASSSSWNPSSRALLQQAISAHIVQWVWTSLMRGSLYLLAEVIQLCNSCKLPFQLVNNVFREHHQVNHPPLWQTISYEECLNRCPSEQIEQWQNDPGFLLTFSTFYGRRFYISSKKMSIFMSAELANQLWVENRQNVLSSFIESLPELVKTESWLITHPSEKLQHAFFCEKKVKNLSSSSASLVKQTTLRSDGSTGPITVVDLHGNRYRCRSLITMYNSLCGKFRTEILRLYPQGMNDETSSSKNNNFTSRISVEEAITLKEKSLEFCQGFGFEQDFSISDNSKYDEVDAEQYKYDSSIASSSCTQQVDELLQGGSDDLVQNLWDVYMQDFALQDTRYNEIGNIPSDDHQRSSLRASKASSYDF